MCQRNSVASMLMKFIDTVICVLFSVVLESLIKIIRTHLLDYQKKLQSSGHIDMLQMPLEIFDKYSNHQWTEGERM